MNALEETTVKPAEPAQPKPLRTFPAPTRPVVQLTMWALLAGDHGRVSS